MTKKGETFSWTERAEGAFRELKEKFICAPILTIFDQEKQIILETDVSDYALEMCVSQPDVNGLLRPVAFYLRKIVPAEMNYEIHDKELLIIMTAFTEWRVYLKRFKYLIKVFTDHKNLTFFTIMKVLNCQQVR